MEADWEFEIAPEAPVIDAAWPGFMDLRANPERIREVTEAASLPELAAAIRQLNGIGSPVYTVRCDLWPLDACDPYEMDADPGEAGPGIGCYIDLLSRNAEAWATVDGITGWCRGLCAELGKVKLRQCRVDLVIRSASTVQNSAGLGVTAYFSACGATVPEAENVLSGALRAFAIAVLVPSPASANDSTLQ